VGEEKQSSGDSEHKHSEGGTLMWWSKGHRVKWSQHGGRTSKRYSIRKQSEIYHKEIVR
jgi:hypothetical protein